jgi:hypothetical protein
MSDWEKVKYLGGERQKHFSALNGALATGCGSMTIPWFAWDGLDSRLQGGNTREHPFSIIAFVIGEKHPIANNHPVCKARNHF